MIQWISILMFPALVAMAAAYDMLTMTIPNRISLALSVAFFPAAYAIGMPVDEFGLHLLAGAAVLAAGFGCFFMGWIGGGDAKLAAAVTLWIGWTHAFEYVLFFAILGGALTIGLITVRRFPLPLLFYRANWIARLHDRATGVPYGIALGFAALLIFPETIWGSAFLPH